MAVNPGLTASSTSRSAHTIPLAAPRPGYPTPVANLNVSSLSPSGPPSGQLPKPQQMGQVPQALRVTRPQADTSVGVPPPIYQTTAPRPSVPSKPHPLQPPVTPIMPIFARPSKLSTTPDIKFSEPILRGNSEDNLLPKRGERGDAFWRRFSMIAKEEKKPSSWLVKTQSGSSRLSRWVWVIGVFLLICAGAGIGLWYYISHTSTMHQVPKAVGGSANETNGPSSPTGYQASSSAYVTPTFTLPRRDIVPESTPMANTFNEDTLNVKNSRQRTHRLRNF